MSEIKLKHLCGFFYRILYQNIKTLILIISGITFFYLLISGFTSDAFIRSSSNSNINNDNNDNKKQLILNTNYHIDLKNTLGGVNGFNNIPWDNNVVQLYLKQLEINYYQQEQQQQQQQQQQDDTNNNNNNKCLYDNVLTVLSNKNDNNKGNIDNLWEYLSLLALCESHLPDNGVQIFLTKYLAKFVENYFEDIIIPLIPEKFIKKCFNLDYAQIIGDTTNIPVNTGGDRSVGGSGNNNNNTLIKYSPILLEQGVKRYQEIILFIDQIRTKLDFKQNLIEDVNNLLIETKIILGNNHPNLTYISIYITDDDHLPINYYTRAMNLHRKLHENIIFIISCDKNKKNYYYYNLLIDTNDYLLNDTIIYEHNKINSDFVFISLLNHTIVSNNLGLIGALLNGGDTIVYSYKNSQNEFYLPWLMSEEISNWKSINVD